MIGLDTNVLVRFLVHDDPVQFARAQSLIRREVAHRRPVFVSLLVLMETEWVLGSRYSYAKDRIAESFSGLLDSADVRFEDEDSVERALFVWRDSRAGFACLIATRHRALGCRATASFDAKAMDLPGFVPA
jgi:predicted nucleic-acid-binding protein